MFMRHYKNNFHLIVLALLSHEFRLDKDSMTKKDIFLEIVTVVIKKSDQEHPRNIFLN